MSGSKSSKSSISLLLSSRIYSNHTGESPCSGPPVSVHPGLQNENNGETCLALSLLSGSNSQFCQNRSKVLSCCSPHNLKTQNVQQRYRCLASSFFLPKIQECLEMSRVEDHNRNLGITLRCFCGFLVWLFIYIRSFCCIKNKQLSTYDFVGFRNIERAESCSLCL